MNEACEDIHKRIIIIDDNVNIHKDFETILTTKPDTSDLDQLEAELFGDTLVTRKPIKTYELSFASQGEEGLEIVKKALNEGRPFNLAFVDMRMPPGWDGLETIEHIWQIDPNIQVVICTAYSDHSWTEITEQLGDTDNLLILKKPFDSIEVAQLASALTGKWELARKAALKLQELEEMVDQRTKELEIAKENAIKASRCKSEFLASMSHELRTPMSAVIGMLDLALDEPLDNVARDYALTAKSSAGILLAIINDILDISKIEAGKIDIEMEECSVQSVLADIETIVRSQVRIKGIEFKIILDTPIPEKIFTDFTRIRQCLLNLTYNAIKFTDKGHVYIRVSSQDKENTSYIRFDIEDTGIGITQEKQNKIFESFAQADNNVTKKYGGTGLGLSITKQFTDLLGGSVSVMSEPEKGSTFTLVIPTGNEGREVPFISKLITDTLFKSEEHIQDMALLPGTILIAEDDLVNRKIAMLMLTKAGFEVGIACNGREAIEAATSRHYDLVLMDVRMPNMNGLDATRALREKGLTVPIIALTANATKDDIELCLAAGCNNHIAKPIERQALLRTIDKYLRLQIEAVDRKAVG
ncbi:MAG: response regulator [bacterium]